MVFAAGCASITVRSTPVVPGAMLLAGSYSDSRGQDSRSQRPEEMARNSTQTEMDGIGEAMANPLDRGKEK